MYKSFKEFFKSMFSAMQFFANSYVSDMDVAKDIAQESFCVVYKEWERFENIDKTNAFIYTTVRNLSLDYLKHQKVKLNYNKSNKRIYNEESFLYEITKQETMRNLYFAINTLPKQSKNIIQLSLKGYTNKDIAEAMNISVNTVKTLKKSAYKNLRKMLSKEYLILLSCMLFYIE